MINAQNSSLLCVGTSKIVLLNGTTSEEMASHQIYDLHNWTVGVDKIKNAMVLEFRGSKSWVLKMDLTSIKCVSNLLWSHSGSATRYNADRYGLPLNVFDFSGFIKRVFILSKICRSLCFLWLVV